LGEGLRPLVSHSGIGGANRKLSNCDRGALCRRYGLAGRGRGKGSGKGERGAKIGKGLKGGGKSGVKWHVIQEFSLLHVISGFFLECILIEVF